MLKKITKLIFFSSFTFASLLFSSTTTKAFSVSFENQIGDDYNYTVNLDADDSLDVSDRIIFNALSGVIDATANSPYSISSGDFDETSANFTVDTPTRGLNTLTGVISLTSADELNNVEYQAFYGDNGTPRVVYGNISAIPFDFSPSLGIIVSLLLLGLHQVKRQKIRFSDIKTEQKNNNSQ